MKLERVCAALCTFMLLLCAPWLPAQAPLPPNHSHSTFQGHVMHATGTFEVKTAPVEASEIGKEAGVGRMTIDKVWTGDLQGTSKGEMLTGITGETGSMAYTAMERVTATLGGKSGTFYFLHRASMMKSDPGSAALEIVVVPSSGTGDLAGISGSLTIDKSKGGHAYDFTYQLP